MFYRDLFVSFITSRIYKLFKGFRIIFWLIYSPQFTVPITLLYVSVFIIKCFWLLFNTPKVIDRFSIIVIDTIASICILFIGKPFSCISFVLTRPLRFS
nr:MAG TPA: hypothetical protein [Caudoviricetes sp.]